MESNMFTFVILLAAAACATAFPLKLMFEHDSWIVRMFPGINISYAEDCYYSSSWKNDSSSYCPEIVTNASPSRRLPGQLIEPLRAMYQDYLHNEPHDRQQLVDCFMLYKYSGNSSACSSSLVTNQTAGLKNTRREHNAQTYLQELVQYQAQVDRCLELEWKMLPMPSDCAFMDELELVEHCFMYHQFDQYEACHNISWPRVKLPQDSRSMYIDVSWHNISFDFSEQLEELRMGMEGVPDPMAIVLYCLHDNSWIEDSNHHCQNVTKPQKGLNYSFQTRKLQKMYNQKRRDELRYDCLTFHKDEKLKACKWITWR